MLRREFITGSVAALVASGYQSLSITAAAGRPAQRVLLLGGTHFLGPALVEAMVAQGHTVTLFNRGITNPELFPNVEKSLPDAHLDAGFRRTRRTRRFRSKRSASFSPSSCVRCPADVTR